MLNIFADALLIATRMEPSRKDDLHRKLGPDAEKETRRRWFALSGMRF